MDKVLSVRVDENAYSRISYLARRLKTSKKKVVEGAVEAYAAQVEGGGKGNVLAETFGAWQRPEPAGKTVSRAKAAFKASMKRHRK